MKCSFYWMGGASWILKVEDVCIGCDPGLAPVETDYNPGKRIIDPKLLLDGADQIEYWLLTHNHVDHIDTEGLNYISPLARIIAHPNLVPRLTGQFEVVTYLNWGEEAACKQQGINFTVRAIPAIHGSSPEMVEAMGSVNGYLVNFRQNQHTLTVYITGDTVPDSRIYEALSTQSVDILIANLGNAYASQPGGPITLSLSMFEDMLHRIEPAIAVPVHFMSFDWFEMSESDLSRLCDIPEVIMPQIGAWIKMTNDLMEGSSVKPTGD